MRQTFRGGFAKAAACGSQRVFLLLPVLFLAHLLPAHAQIATLRGFVTSQSDGQALEDVNVVLRSEEGRVKGAATNQDGLYVVPSIEPGRYVLQASFVGFQTYADTLDLASGEIRTLNIVLIPGEEELDEVVVETERTSGAARVTAGQQTVRPRDIERIPTPDVTGDLVNLLSALPGVVSTGDRGGQLFIRGGEPSQNLVQLDGMLLYQPFHVLGFYSAFPSEIINRADIYSGGFSSRFGERLSSVIDISTRNGNNRRFAGAVGLSPFVSTVRLEGPVIRDRVSVLASGRQSLVEQGASELVNEPLPFKFGDAFVKLHGILTENQRASVTGLHTYDRGTLAENTGGLSPEEVRWKNQAIGARYLILPRIFPILFEGNAAYTRLTSELGPRNAPTRTSSIENMHVSLDGTFFGDRVDWQVGTSLRRITIVNELGGLYQNIEDRSERFVHWGIYVEPEIKRDNGLRIRPGLRVQFFDVRFHPFFEPRLRVVWQRGGHQVSGAVGVYQQTVMGLNDRRDAASIFTAWTNASRPNPRIEDVSEGRVQRAVHVIAGYRTTPTSWLEVSVEGFYKKFLNLFIGEWTAFPRFTTRLQLGTGRAFGFDVRAEVRRGAFYGYVNYGLSSTRYNAKQATLQLWYGTESLRFRPPHDRRHQLNALASLSVFGFDLSARWSFGSGLPFSRALGFDGFALIDDVVDMAQIPGSRRVIYERPFNGVLPTYHRLDVSVERRFSLGRAAVTVQGNLINAYDRRNLFYLDVFTLRRVDQLPLVPSLGLNVDFQ
ncbi:MAG: carboxypeptidase regulatory-like domain-containing protein [Rhodothermales bacterium]